MIAEGFPVIRSSLWPTILPGALIMLFVLAANFMGDRRRDVLGHRARLGVLQHLNQGAIRPDLTGGRIDREETGVAAGQRIGEQIARVGVGRANRRADGEARSSFPTDVYSD